MSLGASPSRLPLAIYCCAPGPAGNSSLRPLLVANFVAPVLMFCGAASLFAEALTFLSRKHNRFVILLA